MAPLWADSHGSGQKCSLRKRADFFKSFTPPLPFTGLPVSWTALVSSAAEASSGNHRALTPFCFIPRWEPAPVII